MTAFERSVTFTAAFDKRHPDPAKNYGIHGVSIRFVLKGPKGATHFLLYTNWQLPHVTKEERHYPIIGGDPCWAVRPMAADLGYHSPVPLYEGQRVNAACDILGAACYYDGTTLGAEPVFERLLWEGDAGVWDELEKAYQRWLVDEAAAVT